MPGLVRRMHNRAVVWLTVVRTYGSRYLRTVGFFTRVVPHLAGSDCFGLPYCILTTVAS